MATLSQRGIAKLKPPASARIDWQHPYARNLKDAWLFNEPAVQTVAGRTKFNSLTYHDQLTIETNSQAFQVRPSVGYGNAIYFNGNYFQGTAGNAGTGAMDNLTWMFVLNPEAIPQLAGILAQGYNSGSAGYALTIESSGISSTHLNLKVNNTLSNVFTDLTLRAHTWQIVTLRRKAGTWSCFLNTLQSTSHPTTTPATGTSNFLLLQADSNVFNGSIATALYWERPLLDAEIFQLCLDPYVFLRVLPPQPAVPQVSTLPAPAPPTPPTPPVTGPQSSQSQRIVTLVAVSKGDVYATLAGGSTWVRATNATGTRLNTTGVVRSAANNQKLWFADGTHYLYYDPSVNSVLAWVATSGTLPADTAGNTPRLICTWRGRTVVSGLKLDGQNWFMSLVNDPTNWNYAPFPFVVTQAVAGNNSPLGLVGDVITSLIPYSDDKLIMGGDHTIYQMSGDPADGGRIDLLTDMIGMAWGNAWAKDPFGNLYFVSNQTGIYTYQPGQGAPVRISQAIEQLLTNINTGTNIIRCQWDDRLQGLHVFVTNATSAVATTHFFWEQRSGAWWTDVFADADHNPLCCVTFDGNTPQDRRALIGSWDGYVRMMDPTATTDDGTAIASTVTIGPLLTKDFDEILMKDLQGILGTSSGTVSYAVYVGQTAEAALASTAVESGTLIAGRGITNHVRRSGHAIYVTLTASSYWTMEAIRARIVTRGKVQRRKYG